MAIYLCLLIPVFTLLVLFFFFRHKTQWWEFIIPVVVSVIFILVGKYMAIKSLTDDTQYLGGYTTQVRYYEAWNEYIHRTCSRSYKCGKSTCHTYYDCSYVKYHPEYWTAETTLGTFTISKKRYNEILHNKFHINQPTFHDMERYYHTQDGDMYYGSWDDRDENLVPVATSETYENKPKASHSVYHFQELDSIDIRTYKPFDYPSIDDNNQQNCLLGIHDRIAEHKLQVLNARLGKSKHVRVFIVVFKNQPVEAGHVQERYWEGSNKNEFVITIGINDKNEVIWVYDFSWTEVQEAKVETREFLLAQRDLNLSAVVDFTYKEIEQRWVPRNFHEFDILTIQPSMTAIMWIMCLTILLNVGMAVWIILNEFEDEESYSKKGWKKRY